MTDYNSKEIAFIGVGSIAIKHIKIIKKNYPRIKMTAIRSGKGRQYNKELKGIKIENKFDLLKEKYFFAIFITNPSSLHLRTLKNIYKTKSNIFIEKPILNKSHNINNIAR